MSKSEQKISINLEPKDSPDVQPTQLSLIVAQSGLEPKEQNKFIETLGRFFEKAKKWEAKVNELVVTSVLEVEIMAQARERRLILKGMRLEGESIIKEKRNTVKAQMANYVLEDKLWLRLGQIMEETYKNLETRLEDKERFKIKWEMAQKEELNRLRLAELLPLGFVFQHGFNLGDIDDEMYKSIKLGLEAAKQAKETAAKAAQEAEAKKLKLEEEEKAKMAADNKRLREENERKDKEMKDAREKAEAKQKKIDSDLQKVKDLAEKNRIIVQKAADDLKDALKASDEKAKMLEKVVHDNEYEIDLWNYETMNLSRTAKIKLWIDSVQLKAPEGMETDADVLEILERFKLVTDKFKKWAKNSL